MKSYSVSITDLQYNILKRIADKDNTTVKELLNKQVNYYLSTIIESFVNEQPELTVAQKQKLNEKLLITKDSYLTSIGK